MLRIIICLLLVPGAFSLLDEDNLQDLIQPDKVQNTEPNQDSGKTDTAEQNNPANIDSRPALSKPKTKLPPQLNAEQINMLADKVLRIHGVQPDSDDEENQKNIDELRKVVANVEKNLNEKLKLTQMKAKVTTDNAISGAKEATEAQEENKVPDETVDNPTENKNKKDPQNFNENVPENSPQPSDTINKEKDIIVEIENKANEEIIVESSLVDRNEKHEEEKETELIVESRDEIEPSPQNESKEKPSDEVSPNEEDENINVKKNTNTNDLISDSTEESVNETENDVESTAKGSSSNTDDITETNTEQQEDFESNQILIKTENNVESTANASSGNTDNIAKTSEYNKEMDTEQEEDPVNLEINNTDNGEGFEKVTIGETNENEENTSQEDVSEEEEISGSCGVNEECSQVDEQKLHAYSEEYNVPVINEEELETEIEDTHLQRVLKFFSSFLN